MNPNLTELGVRKKQSGQKQPDWLFPSVQKVVTTSPPAAKSKVDSKMKNKQAKKIANELLKRRAAGEPSKSATQSPLADLIGTYLIDNNYTLASQAFKAERAKRGEGAESVDGTHSLDAIFVEWMGLKGLDKESLGNFNGKPEASVKAISNDDIEMADAPPVSKTLKKSSSESSSDSSSSESSISSDSDADDETEQQSTAKISPKAKSNRLKRKAPSSSSSSSSGSSSSDSSSSDSDAPKTKKIKASAVKSASSTSSSGSSDSDSSSDSDVHESKVIKELSGSSSSNSSSSSSESDSEESDSSTHSTARKVPLPASDSESDSDSSSSDSDSPSASIKEDQQKMVGSDTSATLSDGPKKQAGSSSDSSSDSSSSSESEVEAKNIKAVKSLAATTVRPLSPPLPPNPVGKAARKKANEPFQRIKADVQIDARLASNAYVPYDYAQKAHEDLIVTRGKGFTKEKNKKKRGSYRGGFIDVDGKKGIKFDD